MSLPSVQFLMIIYFSIGKKMLMPFKRLRVFMHHNESFLSSGILQNFTLGQKQLQWGVMLKPLNTFHVLPVELVQNCCFL